MPYAFSNCKIVLHLVFYIMNSYYTVESGYLAHAPDESTTATCELDNRTSGLASSIILTHPHL